MRVLCGVILVAGAAFCQTSQRPEFEVASIKPSGDMTASGQLRIGLHIDGAQVRCTYLTLKDYVTMAYKLKNYQFSGPDWMGSQRFDISAKLPDGATREQVGPMLQTLLEDRFQLKVHRGSKEFSVYALTVGKNGLKVKESAQEDGPEAVNVDVSANGRSGTTTVNLGKGSSLSYGENKLTATKVTMAVLADQLGRFMDRPVVDQTDLKGTYDFSMEFTQEEFLVLRIRLAVAGGVQLPPQALQLLENSSDAPVLSAIQALGLKLESKKAPLETLVVDSALKAPSVN
jgi:uncharacterized protein (TIGR03435 family)